MDTWPGLLARTYDLVRIPMIELHGPVLERPSPCSEWSVRELAQHAIGAIEMCAEAAAGSRVTAEALPGTSLLDRFDAGVARNLAAWRAMTDPSRVLTLPFGEFPADVVAGINQLDSLVHAWDIGAAVGVEVKLPDELAEVAMRMARVRVPLGRGHVFGPEVMTEGSTSGEKLLAFTGRDPFWVAAHV